MRTEKLPMSSRLLRVREFTDKVVKKSPKRTVGDAKSRFVDPCHFSPEDKAALEQLLADAGIGDDEGRKLFVTAVEFEVGGLRSALRKETESAAQIPAPVVQHPPSKAQIELLQLGQSAAHFKSLLESTHKTARQRLGDMLSASDPFGREHGPGYLQHLAVELERISRACEGLEPVAEPEPATPEPVIGPIAGKLVRQVARIYDECLEADPEKGGVETLAAVLGLIAGCTQLAIPAQKDVILDVLKAGD